MYRSLKYILCTVVLVCTLVNRDFMFSSEIFSDLLLCGLLLYGMYFVISSSRYLSHTTMKIQRYKAKEDFFLWTMLRESIYILIYTFVFTCICYICYRISILPYLEYMPLGMEISIFHVIQFWLINTLNLILLAAIILLCTMAYKFYVGITFSTIYVCSSIMLRSLWAKVPIFSVIPFGFVDNTNTTAMMEKFEIDTFIAYFFLMSIIIFLLFKVKKRDIAV